MVSPPTSSGTAISEATRLDAPMQQGPVMRLQGKALDSGVRSISLGGKAMTVIKTLNGTVVTADLC